MNILRKEPNSSIVYQGVTYSFDENGIADVPDEVGEFLCTLAGFRTLLPQSSRVVESKATELSPSETPQEESSVEDTKEEPEDKEEKRGSARKNGKK